VKISRLAMQCLRVQHDPMSNEKFKTMCEQILVPRIGDMLHVQLVDVNVTLELFQAELIRIGKQLDGIAAGREAKS
jgi:hypothetical protein